MEALLHPNKVVEVNTVNDLPKFPDTNVFYHVKSPSESWWRWHYGEYCEYEQSPFAGRQQLMPKLTGVANCGTYAELPKQGRVGVKYCIVDAEFYEEYVWNRNTGQYVQISGPSSVVLSSTLATALTAVKPGEAVTFVTTAALQSDMVMPTALYGQIRNVRERIETLYDAVKHCVNEDQQGKLQEAIRAHFSGA